MAQKNILLVDDDDALRQMYTLILGKAGYNVETAVDGVEGLAKIRQGSYDLILLDLMMPNLDGIGVLRGLDREPAKVASGPIVILSNAGYDQIAHEVESLGGAGFLMKADLLPDDLIKEVNRYLEGGNDKKSTKS